MKPKLVNEFLNKKLFFWNDLIYISTIDLHDSSAQSGQILAMSKAFEQHLRERFNFIGLSSLTNIRGFRWAATLRGAVGKIVKSILLALLVFRSAEREFGVFTREVFIATLFVLARKNVMYEIHQEPNWGGFILLKFLGLFKNFKLLAISHGLANAWFAKLGENRVFVYHDGVDTQIIDDACPRHQDGFLKSKVAVYTGSFHKGRDVLSLEPLFGKYDDWTFYLVGAKAGEFDYYKQKFSGFKNVHVISRVNANRVRKYQASASVLLYPLTTQNSLWKFTSPLKLFEYMLARKPIVASCIGSICELLDSSNAFVYSTEDEIIDAFERLLHATQGELSRMVEHNYKMVLEKYNWKSRVAFILEIT
ncbi:glycosyltransferase family 4 protein [Teredinibacter turnerae]|uniref:glycosyltransferase family 4 protein n=1 Tax=Teredinibacter turnerae TaxID=2426 RepID=UPI00036F9588|nr:glycosyltransferase family 4 protein [Teredinibacter turnerae]